MKYIHLLISSSLLLLLCLSAKEAHAWQNEEISYILWFGGGSAKDTDRAKERTADLSAHMSGSREEAQGVLFLGDQLHRGLSDSSGIYRTDEETVLRKVYSYFHKFSSPVYFLPGDEDWDANGRHGWNRVKKEGIFLDSLFAQSSRAAAGSGMYPKQACPGPEEIALSEDVVLILFDSQWLMQPWDKPRVEDGCGLDDPADLIGALSDALLRNANKHIILASHHPVFNEGKYGGAVIPGVNDANHPRYKAYRDILRELMGSMENIIHLSGHSTSQQYFAREGNHFIVSGALAEGSRVGNGSQQYAQDTPGYGRLVIYKSGEVKLEFFGQSQQEQYSKVIYTKPYVPAETIDEYAARNDFSDSTILATPSEQYEKKESGYWFIGENYRDLWNTQVRVSVFDIGKEHGGLKIVQRGGGQQTKSLRLEAANGKQYVLRSVEKFAKGAIPPALRSTFAADLVQDQISASNPFAAYIVPYLAEPAQVYHTNPTLVFIPDDPRFGSYRKTFGGILALYEERPDDDWSTASFFGNSSKIRSTSSVLEKLYKDNDNWVDQEWVVKSRLFDMLIGDWDRHDDQWRWASFDDEETGGQYYRPIPRDRDQAFFVNNGFLMGIVKRKWAMPKFQGWDEEYFSIEHFSFNARYFDRTFLNGLSREQWVTAAKELQSRMTDEVITDAVQHWPKEVYEQRGEETIRKLKSNRDHMVEYAERVYTFLAKEVDIVGSNKKERFEVERINDEETRVRVWKLSKKKDEKRQKIYDRTFLRSETKEIRLYGLGGEDEFEIDGEVKKGIRVRIIGGSGKDVIDDDSRVSGLSRKTIVYDTRTDNKLKLNSESKNRTSDAPGVNDYNRKAFQYNVTMPLINFNFNPDDGVFLGGGFLMTRHGFRKEPFKTSHQVVASTAVATQSYTFDYKGIFTKAVGSFDLEVLLEAREPNFVTNFFGVGNETSFDQDAEQTFNVPNAISYYRTRFSGYGAQLLLRQRFGKNNSLYFGNALRVARAEPDGYDGEDRFILDYAATNPAESIFETRYWDGLTLGLELDGRDRAILPRRGAQFNINARSYVGLNDISSNFTDLNLSLAWFGTIRLPAELTFATRLRGGHTTGDFPFYVGQTLSGLSELRGYRKTRFFGESKLVSNTELRLSLFTINNPIVPARLGLLAFHDYGRVWVEGENSDKWHQGYGGGIWLAPLDAAVLSFEVGSSEEETIFYVRFGHLF